ncbi:MAG TPA: metalloregulator ArsR/SmtB family transcription factor [Vitreimonas sp.]|nr:metalloregulator ArsR/SmtB family transcription factor [Vitreimonas sp.]
MVEYNSLLNAAYYSLSDPTRRDILLRVAQQELPIKDIAQPYDMSFAAVAKHVAVLETACLVRKRKLGKQQLVSASPETLALVTADLSKLEKVWNERFKALDELLESTK